MDLLGAPWILADKHCESRAMFAAVRPTRLDQNFATMTDVLADATIGDVRDHHRASPDIFFY